LRPMRKTQATSRETAAEQRATRVARSRSVLAAISQQAAGTAAKEADASTPAPPAAHHVIWDGVEFSSPSQSKSESASAEVGALPGRRVSLRRAEFRYNSEEPSSQSMTGEAGQQAGAEGEQERAAEEEEEEDDDGDEADEAEAERTQQDGVMSVGSAKHDSGTCKPCILYYSPIGCKDGANCRFCHRYHTRRSRTRVSKGKRERHRRFLDAAANAIVNETRGPRKPLKPGLVSL